MLNKNPYWLNYRSNIANFSKSKCLGEVHQSKCEGEMVKEKNEQHHHWIYICDDFRIFLRQVRFRLCTKNFVRMQFWKIKSSKIQHLQIDKNVCPDFPAFCERICIIFQLFQPNFWKLSFFQLFQLFHPAEKPIPQKWFLKK